MTPSVVPPLRAVLLDTGGIRIRTSRAELALRHSCVAQTDSEAERPPSTSGMAVANTNSEAAIRGSYVAPWVIDSGACSNLLELNGARSNPQAGVELSRVGALHDELLRRASAEPREPRPVPRHPARVLATITRVLEEANCPMRAREIHVAASELVGEPLLRKSVKAALSADVASEHSRFRRVRHGVYQLARDVRRCTS